MDPTVLSFAGQSNKWNSAKDAAPVAEAIKNHKVLKVLDLENNTLNPDAALVIGEALALHPELERAKFKDLFTGRLKMEIPLALKRLFAGINKAGAKLVELDLSDNALGPIGVEGMVEFMRSPSCYTLEELRLNNNGLGITGGTMLAEALDSLIENSARDGHPWKLKVFIAGRNRLEKVGAKIYAEIFRKLGSLEELAMPQNGIFHEGIAALAKALAENPKLRILNLNDNTFTRKGAEAMAKYLHRMPALEVINFGDCLLRNPGAQAIARVLMQGHQSLRELNMDGNELTTQAALSIVEAMQNKPHLTKLTLDDNMFGEDGKDNIFQFLADIGKEDILVPLENNLEPDSDEEQEEDEESESEEESEEDSQDEESDVEVVRVVEAQKQQSVRFVSKPIEGPVQPIAGSVADFVADPSAGRLLGLVDKSSVTVAAISSCKTPDQEISTLVRLFVKIAAFAHTTDENLASSVKETVKELAKDIFTRAKSNRMVSFTTNTVLVNLGLIKSEDKNFSVTWDVKGVMISLLQLVNEEFFPQSTKDSLKSFLLDNSYCKLDGLPQEKNQLITALAS